MNRSRHDFGLGHEVLGGEPIAIVGASCRLPGAPDLESFWRLLIDGIDAVTTIPDDRWNKGAFFHPERGQRGKAYTFAAGVLDNVDRFDPAFFGISPREATQMDPQQRLLLELAYEAIEDGGIDVATLAGRQVGVFVGGSSWDYMNLNSGDPSTSDAYSMIGVTLSPLANRISYAFDLHGPSFTVDTACSSSLVALHQACEAMRGGQIDTALVGGVGMLLAPQSFIGFCQASMLSPKGRCHAFDARADGYVRAEGGGMVVLKPLGAALEAGDPIRAIIRGTGVNSDGRTPGLSLPNKLAQAALLRDVYTRFGLDCSDLAYVEAHGTGTPAGDPIEAGALGSVLGANRTAPLPIGSVKTNVGHLEAGSGMAGLLKAMLVAERGIIPASLNSETPNPNIPFDDLNLTLAQDAIVLPDDGRTRLVGVNSFGFGGTNAHAVLAAADRRPALHERASDRLPPLLISARSEGALRALAAAWRDRLAEQPADLPALVRGAALRRSQHPRRLTIPAGTAAEAIEAIEAHLAGKPSAAAANTAVAGGVGFVFSGNGSQWAGMAADAMAGSASFRNAIATVDAALAPWLGWSVGEALANADAEALRNTDIAQPLLFAIQVALVMGLRAEGIEPDACMGHSVGEVAAAWAAGALDLTGAARVIAARSRAQQTRHGIGAMAVLGLDAATSAAALATPNLAQSGVELAAHNSSRGTTVAGPIAGIALLEAEAKREGWRFTKLDLDYAFHSAAMDPIQPQLAVDLKGLAPIGSRLPFFSTVTGAILEGEALDAAYWWRNVRAPVLFAEAARAMVDDGIRIFVEIGPHAILGAYLTDALSAADKEGRVLGSLARRPLKHDPIATIAARAHAAGADIRRADAFVGEAAVRGLPSYPWQRERFWVPRTEEATDTVVLPFEHPLLGQRRGDQPLEWRRHIGLELQPWLADHVVGGAAVVPAAALLEIALAAARARHPNAAALDLLDVEIGRALVVEQHMIREMRLRIGSAAGDFELSSRPRLAGEAWITHMSGRIAEGEPMPDAPFAEPVPQGRVDGETLYAIAHEMGLDYGPTFRAVEAIDLLGDDRALVRFGTAAVLEQGLLLPPNLVDGALQGLLAMAADRLGSANGILPWRFGRLRLLTPEGAEPAAARLHVTRIGPRSVRADIVLLDAAGAAVAMLGDCWFVRVILGRAARAEEQFFHPAIVSSLAPDGEPAAIMGDIAIALGETGADAGEESRLLVDAYATSAALAALLPLADKGVLRPQALLREERIAASSRPLLDRLLRWLDADALAEQHADGSWTFAAADLPRADAILRTLLFDSPRGVAEMALLALAGDALPTVLREGPGAYPALPAALWDQLLSASPASTDAAEALADAVARVAPGRPGGRSLRILEIGARRGSFTRLLLRTLHANAPVIVAATEADDQPMLAALLEKSAGARAITWAPGQPLDEPPFDLIVSAHGLSLGDPSAAGLASLRPLLAPGGMLLAAEPAPSRLWQLLRPDAPPLADGARWRTQLDAAGFAETGSRPLPTGLWPACLIAARADEAIRSAQPATASLTLFADASPSAEAIAAGLREAGTDLTIRPPAGLTHSAGPIAILIEGHEAGLAERLALIAGLASWPASDEPTMVTILIHGEASADPQSAAMMGVRRVLANEASQIASRLIRLSSDLTAEQATAYAVAELLYPDSEQEVAWNRNGRHVARVRRGLPVARDTAPGTLRLAIQRPGLLDSLGWEVAKPDAPGARELAIEVRAAGLNFRDVMWAMGLLPDEALLDGFAGPTLGLECAGIVTAIGEGVGDFAVGDRVMAFAPASLSTHTVTAAHAVMRMPAGMDFTAAATVPVAFLTVAYALGHLAQLGEGETILIHGGAGGVGLAAIQYARHRGARIFATAGSPAKRALLTNLGAEAVLDSRSLSFADEVMRLTDGQGVDVVLNSLAGEAMRRSLALVRPFGRFLELGKRDFYENSSIGLRPFRHNVSYFGIDADQLPLRRPKLAGALFAEISAMFAAGALRALPHRVYDFADAEDAFRLMQASGHVGKIVLTPGAVLPVALPSPPAFALRDDRTYVVTGGLDGFGLETARWLARRGARHIALLGRRGPATPDAAAKLAAFEEIDVRAYAVDVADEAALAETLETIRTSQPPIAGIIHAAVAMDDALLTALDASRFDRALRPKLRGAELLDRLTRSDPIEHFILFSSVTTPLGNPGQGNYVAANAAIEALAERRHAEGLPALAVQWGPIGDAGYLARETQVSEMLARQLGGAHLSAAEALDTIPSLLAAGIPVAGVATVRWAAMKARLPLLASPLFAEMGGTVGEEAGELDLAAMLAGCGPEEARTKVTGLLIEEVARIMKLAADRIEPSRPLTELGMDSLMAVELRLAVEQRFGVTVPLLALSEGATLSAMAGRIVRGLGEPAAPEQSAGTPDLAEWLARHEGSAATGPADGATAPTEPGFAAAAATSP
ncbi:SDR family NAD(P)-dependent oxidoreductase [Sphingomonas sp. MMS24-J13]|uniref:SDR family NAD(P)-dependent oxidoreductase n=1 Tax=Sphingomonas sp. MMS24-J13 TaxID=3238686 RepID=UPI00384FCE98